MKDVAPPPQAALRPPAEVMRLRRMGAAFPTRLSFLRTLMRALGADGVRVTRPVWRIDERGFGHAVYSLRFGGHDYALVAVSTELPDAMRTDRVIATAWDTSYVLHDGFPDTAEIARIVASAPRQEAARFSPRDLVLSRANKSVRLFSHVVDALRAGRQPDLSRIAETGYLMRTTAVYGNGKFGIADRDTIARRPGLSGPFMAEMLTVWLIRGFTHDLAEHMGGAPLDRAIRRQLGIGNATGLGMAPFLVNHPMLLDAWMQVRETALARVRALETLDADPISRLQGLGARVAAHLASWNVADPEAADRIAQLRREWPAIQAALGRIHADTPRPVDAVITVSRGCSVDLQELVVAMVLEPFGDLVDGLADCMATPFQPVIDAAMPVGDLAAALARDWSWALDVDYDSPAQSAQFWYVSEEKQEPRLGLRAHEPGADRETPLDVARRVAAMAADLAGADDDLAGFLRRYPQHRSAVRRVQTVMRHPYAEIRDNLIGKSCRPIDMLRCKLAFFGAAGFDPKSDRWTRITLAQGAPLFDELDAADDWWLPVFAPAFVAA
ncbi:MAG: hypothetical protein NXH82_17065 [Rhodobacteraceae bacterium]|nr:hypothetical protein [Paracoccaceae bacterium]